jgi:hypothetical protein
MTENLAIHTLGVLGPDGTLTRFVHAGVDAQTQELIGALPTGCHFQKWAAQAPAWRGGFAGKF